MIADNSVHDGLVSDTFCGPLLRIIGRVQMGTLAQPSTFCLVGLIERFKAWRAAKTEDRAAIARALQEERRAGDEPPKSLSETVGNAAGEFPPSG